ncbi:MAG: hypothetical protein KF760_18960 [Candidatus Eremiobacteraeota bacterium]|nr:hypothetical protein [Candidatus Eremiobacteraeota bacterium]
MSDTSPGPARLARLWQRWNGRHRASRRHSRHGCCIGMVDALTWEARLTWLLLLLEGHGERAIDPLLELLRRGDEEIRQLAAVGLAQLGRQVLPDLRERWRSAGLGEKQAICQILWYLGPLAHGCLDWARNFDHPWARAAFYAMEEHGWPALLATGNAPIWLDQRSLESVGALVFSTHEADRSRALAALGGWGPAEGQARQLLEVLARDPVGSIAQAALEALLQQAGPISQGTLQYALLQAGGKNRSAALKRLFGSAPEIGSLAQQRGLIRTLRFWSVDWSEQLLDHLELYGLPDPESAHRLLPLDSEKAVRVYLQLEGDVQPLLTLARQGPIELARLIFHRLWKEQNWDGLAVCLERSEFLEIFLHQDILGEILRLREFDHASRLVLALHRLRKSERQSISEWAGAVLQSLEVARLDWPEWGRLGPEQQERKLRIMEWQRTMPEGLVRAVRRGVSPGRRFLDLLAEHHVEARDILLQGLARCPSAARAEFIDPLRRFGTATWCALLELPCIEEFDRVLAPQLHSPEVQDSLLARGPQAGASFSPILRMTAAESLLNSKAPADEGRLAWARELIAFPESATCALYYLLRCFRDEGRQRLLELLDHENPRMRYQALAAARFTLADWPQLLLSRPSDPDPDIRRHILVWLASKGDLTDEESAQVKRLLEPPLRRDEPRED